MVVMKILVVDDEQAVRESLRRSLTFNGYDVVLAEDGASALDQIGKEQPDLVILDVMMPRMDGLEVCRTLRSSGDDRPMPFALEELLARVRSLFRRAAAEAIGNASTSDLVFEDLHLNPDTRDVTRGERTISLTRTEFALLELLMANPRRVLSRSAILEDVWGYDFPTSGNALEVYIGYLRRKTEAGGEPRLIHTVRGVGYVLRETAP